MSIPISQFIPSPALLLKWFKKKIVHYFLLLANMNWFVMAMHYCNTDKQYYNLTIPFHYWPQQEADGTVKFE